MKKHEFAMIVCLVISVQMLSQNERDSLVTYEDLKFHSLFEKKAFDHFITAGTDTFNLFLSIDETVMEQDAKKSFRKFFSLFSEIDRKKIRSTDTGKGIKHIYEIVHGKFLKKYTDFEFFPALLENGNYNCVSASILYALVFEQTAIPYKIMVSDDHVYLVANPGEKSVVVETTNPVLVKEIISGKFKKNYVKELMSNKLVNKAEIKRKSVDEIFQENQVKVREIKFTNLPALQYYNRGLEMLKNNKPSLAYEFLQKAYFLFPDMQIEKVLTHALVYSIHQNFSDQTYEIEYLIHISRYNNIGIVAIPDAFAEILSNSLKYNNKEEYCDSIYHKLISGIKNQKITDEICFVYYEQMCEANRHSEKLEAFSYNALKIKPDHKGALESFEYALQRKYEQISDNLELLDTVGRLKQRYPMETVKKFILEYELIGWLGLAYELYRKKMPETAEEYLQKFEKTFELPVNNRELLIKIVDAYRGKAEFYSGKDQSMEKEALEKGLSYVPNSSILKVLLREKGYLRKK